MDVKIEKTIVVSAAKRSGGTLLNNLFDSHPGVMAFADEAFFWEHVYNYQERGNESIFIDIFKSFDPKSLEASFIDRAILPWIDGILRGINDNDKFEFNLGFKREVFLDSLKNLESCSTVSEIWSCLAESYAKSIPADYSGCKTAFMFGGDWGRSMIATKNTLEDCRCVFSIRNPYYALESLKKSRLVRGEKILHPINFAQIIRHYFFFWNNKDKILDERTILVRFEDLLSEPKKTMKIVAEHVGVEYTDNLITPTLLGKPWRGGSSFKPQKGIDKSVLNRKIEILSSKEIEFIGEHLKPILDYFDYKI